MNYLFSRESLLSFILLLFGTCFLQNNGIAQSNNSRFERNVKYVNGYKVVKGERPPVNLDAVPVDAFEQGKIYVKFNSDVKHLISDNEISTNHKGHIVTGLKKLDDYFTKYGVTSAKQSISGLYKINSKAQSNNLRHEAWGLNLWYELSIDANSDIKKAVSEFQQLTEVEIAEPVYKIRLIAPVYTKEIALTKSKASKTDETWLPNDEFYKNNQWHYNNTGQYIVSVSGTEGIDVDLERAWTLEKGNPNVIVAVMDGGIDFKHPDLNANMWSQIGPDGLNTKPCKQNHGTHVAGTVAGVSNNSIGIAGVAGGSGSGDGVRLMSLDIFEGSHGLNDLGLYIYSADNGAAISQNSWGYLESGVYNQSALDGIDYFVENGGGGALLEGGIVIFAAGNDNDGGDWYPGYYSPTLAVAAHNNLGKRSSFSNYGNWVDITAPGTNIFSTGNVNSDGDPTYIWMSGTSMACPHVSGVAALVVSHSYGQMTTTRLRDVLLHGVDNVYKLNPGYINQLGSGRLNAYKAIMSIPDFTADITIVNEEGEPIKDIEISINDTNYKSNSEGKVTLTLMFDEYIYKINTSGYIPIEGAFSIIDSDVNLEIQLLYDRSTVDFTIINESGEPIQNAEVIVNETKSYTNSEGKISFILASGRYTYEVSAGGHITTDNNFSISYSDVSFGIVLLSENTDYPNLNGDENVCIGSKVIYSISLTDAGVFDVQNGEVVSKLGENRIMVDWTDGSNGKVYFRLHDEDGFITTVSKMVNIDNTNRLAYTDKPDVAKKGSIPILICTTPNLEYKWFFEGNEVSGQTRQDYAPRGLTGNFRVQTIDNNQCPNTSDAVSATSVATSDIEVNVFPNPANKAFSVSFTSEDTGDGIIVISNSYGKVIFQESITKNNPRWEKRYQLNELTQGVYIVKVILNKSTTASSRVTVY